MSDEQLRWRFYTTPVHDCSYLADQKATTLFLDPTITINHNMSGFLADNGFRRSGSHYYRPHCQLCNACTSIRVMVNHFQKNRSQRRVWNGNKDLTVQSSTPEFTRERYRLYRRYIKQRHSDGDMFPPSPQQFCDFLCQDSGFTRFYEFRKDQKLLAVAVVDYLPSGLSAIYTFFDPDFHSRSLGTFCILWQIEETKCLQKNYLYLGYWIQNCSKMAYKARYIPQERYINSEWRTT
ncbi:MAG: arginyltransferase [Endozoicomonadaceae bacterium]|nr:arginyltransferase [Endozoicomonadaceae bacterium]